MLAIIIVDLNSWRIALQRGEEDSVAKIQQSHKLTFKGMTNGVLKHLTWLWLKIITAIEELQSLQYFVYALC